MTTPDLTHVTNLLLTQGLSHRPAISDNSEWWSLSDDGSGRAILWRINPATDEWIEVARVHLTVDVKPRTPGAVVVGGVVYTGEEGA